MKINLEAKGNEQILLLKYLEENASDVLAEKINNGVTVEKDGITLIMKKDLKGFMKYALEEAKKLAEKGASGACVEDKVVYGWLMHYFEEDAIEGKYFNLDGTPYTPPKKETKKAKTTTTVTTTPKPKKKAEPEAQFTLFDMITANGDDTETLPTIPKDTTVDDEDDDMPSEEEIQEIMAELHKEEIKPAPAKPLSPFYSKYLDIQSKYPSSIVVYRLGDFYEVLGDNAKLIADELELTLTGRDCGLESRVPMVGFPYHCSEKYFLKLHYNYDIVIVEKEDDIQVLEKRVKKTEEPEKHWIDEFTYVDENGEVHEIERPSLKVPEWLLNIFGKDIIGR